MMQLTMFLRWTLLAILLLAFMQVRAASEINAVTPTAPGFGKLTYELAAVGSYKLPPLGKAPDGQVLDEQGQAISLQALYKGKYTLLSFIYSNCKDVNGCPLSSYVFYKLKTEMRKDKVLAENLRLVSFSFDPERDTPEVMRLYAANFNYAGHQGEWRFLTTSSVQMLTPILQAYNQDIQREKSINGEERGDISHILRVFIIDPQLNIRNIYSVGFLHADLIINDLKTLLADAADVQSVAESENNNTQFKQPVLSQPGDLKDGYEFATYTTSSKSITARKGKTADLLTTARNPPLGLPRLPASQLKALSAEKIALGRKLFFDRRLSLNDTFSCAMCHVPEQGFTSNELSMAVGIEGRSVRRNSPTIYNVAYASVLFHDGREQTLEQQVWSPLLAHNEMANPSIGYVINKIRQLPDYEGLFEAAFNEEGVNMLTMGEAIAAYERTLISADSAFDRWYFGRQAEALDESAQRGFKLFTGKGNCMACHTIEEDYALFSDNQLHNTGIGFRESMGIKADKERVILAPGVFVEVDRGIFDAVGEEAPADLGLYEVTQNPDDRWKYKTPSLRNISLSAPYMHNGSLRTLEAVVRFYNDGGISNELLDPRVRPLELTEAEIDDLVSFLESLTGRNVDILVADAFAAPIGDVTDIEPHGIHAGSTVNE